MRTSIDLILSRLDKVKLAGAGKWKACCPAHSDRDPSLSIAETETGKILLHCWASCDVRDILAAIGLGFADLFPSDCKRQQRRGPSREAVELERQIVTIGRTLQARGIPLHAYDLERLELANQRLAKLEGLA